MNPLRTLGGSNRSRCGAVRVWRQKCRSEVSIRSVVQKCRLQVSFVQKCRVAQKYQLEVSTEVLLGSVDQKICSEVSIRSVEQKSCSEVLLRHVPQKCCQKCGSEVLLRTRTVDQIRWIRRVAQKCQSEVSLKSVAQKCQSKVLLRSVAQKCRTELLLGSFGQKKCDQKVLLRGIAHCSEASLRSVAQERRSCR